MKVPAPSTIAQVLYPNEMALDFARIVSELDLVLSRLRGGDAVHVGWDCDDLVTFDIADTRILLACIDYGTYDRKACLMVSVGPRDVFAVKTVEALNHPLLCSRLVERIASRFPPSAILWTEVVGTIDIDVIDGLADALPAQAFAQATGRSTAASTVLAFPSATPPDPQPVAANDQPDLPPVRDHGLIRLRDALYPQPSDRSPQISTQMRLTASCFNATLILVYAPLGAAVMTYSLLKGEDIRLSSRLMAVAGTVFALAQTPFGQSVKAMAGTVVSLSQTPFADTVRIISGS